MGDWKYGLWNEKKYIPTFFRDHAHLWVDSFDRLLGFVLSEDGANIFFIFTARGHAYLYDEILHWTIAHWSTRYSTLLAEVHEHQEEALVNLERRGFHSLGTIAVTRVYDLAAQAHEPACLKPTYRIVNMIENDDYRSKGLLYLNGFSGKDEVSELNLTRSAHSREQAGL